MGRLPKQPADFIFVYLGVPCLVEVKEEIRATKIAASRLTQSPKMKRFCMAGGQAYYIIYHYTEDVWRLLNVTDPDKKTGTLDVSKYTAHQTIEELFNVLLPLIKLLQPI